MKQLIGVSSKPITETGKTKDSKIAKLVRNYPESLFRGRFYVPWVSGGSSIFYFQPEDIGRGKSCSRFLFEISDQSYHIRIEDTWSFSRTSTSIDLDNKTGGIVDGIAIAGNKWYLIWAFLDKNFRFAGIGLTRKPFSLCLIPTGNKGSTATFTVQNGYQFTIGARVCVQSNYGTAPMYEWNWGTIQNVTNTALTITLDNQWYGTNLTATATVGNIIQWDKFRPFVVTSSSQTLYKPYYSLLGEVLTNPVGGGSSYFVEAFRADNHFRPVEGIFWQSTIGGTSDVSLCRYLPLWALKFDFAGLILGGTAGDNFAISTSTHSIVMNHTKLNSSINDLVFWNGCELNDDGHLWVTTSTSGPLYFMGLRGFWVDGGMKA